MDLDEKFKFNQESLKNSSIMDSAYLSQVSNIDAMEEFPNLTIPNNNRRRRSMCEPIILTEIQKDKYQKAYSVDQNTSSSSPTDECGTIEFAIQYSSETNKLIVNLLRVFDIKLESLSSSSELYCKCTIMPDKFSYDTKLVLAMQDIVFEEQFEFNYLDASHLNACSLEISLYEFNKSFDTTGECLGSTTVRLDYSSIEMKKILVKDLKRNTKKIEKSDYKGELILSLCYLPGAERLTINIRKAINLSYLDMDKKILPDPYVKISVLEKDGRRLKKKKTSTEKMTVNPVFNQEVVFTKLKKEQLENLTISFTVYNDSIKNREILGHFELNSNSIGNKYTQWKSMLDGKKSTPWWHQLEMPDHAQNNEKAASVFNFVHRSNRDLFSVTDMHESIPSISPKTQLNVQKEPLCQKLSL